MRIWLQFSSTCGRTQSLRFIPERERSIENSFPPWAKVKSASPLASWELGEVTTETVVCSQIPASSMSLLTVMRWCALSSVMLCHTQTHTPYFIPRVLCISLHGSELFPNAKAKSLLFLLPESSVSEILRDRGDFDLGYLYMWNWDFELRASLLQNRHFTTWATPPAQAWMFTGSDFYCSRTALRLDSTIGLSFSYKTTWQKLHGNLLTIWNFWVVLSQHLYSLNREYSWVEVEKLKGSSRKIVLALVGH